MRARGIDFSKWADDWVLPPESRVDFAIQRLGYGLTLDQKYENHSHRMGQVGIRGGYWYYYTQFKWADQVDRFLEAAADHPYKLHMLWWDVETGYNDFSNRQRVANETAEAIRRIENNFDGRAGIYCNLDVYNNYLRPYLGDDWLRSKPLWLAWPNESNPIEYYLGDPEPLLPKGRKTWDIWQCRFTGDPKYYGIIGKKAVDEDVFNGTESDMRDWLGIPRWYLSLEEIKRRAERMLARMK